MVWEGMGSMWLVDAQTGTYVIFIVHVTPSWTLPVHTVQLRMSVRRRQVLAICRALKYLMGLTIWLLPNMQNTRAWKALHGYGKYQ